MRPRISSTVKLLAHFVSSCASVPGRRPRPPAALFTLFTMQTSPSDGGRGMDVDLLNHLGGICGLFGLVRFFGTLS
jgi:hypothetical protein